MVGLTFTADGKQLLCGCADGEVMAADATSGAVLWKTNPGGRNVRAIATSPDGKMLAVATEHVMWMLETGHGRMSRVMKLDTKSFGLAFSPEGKTMVTAGKDGKIYLWDNQTGKLLRPMDGAACNAVAFCPMAPPPLADAPKGQSIAVAEDKGLRVFDLENGKEKFHKPVKEPLRTVAYHPSGKSLATAGDDRYDCHP